MRSATLNTSVLLAVLAAGLLAMPAAAGTADDPEIIDACGLSPDTPHNEASAGVTPWADICAGWVETLTGDSGPPAVRLTLEYAGDITERPLDTRYWLSFTVGECRYHLEHDDAGESLLGVRCGPATFPYECPPPFNEVTTCSRANPPEIFPAVEGVVVEDGNRLLVTLVLAGALADRAEDFAEGSVLENLYTTAHGVNQLDGGYLCYGAGCTAFGGDEASGSDYTVEAGSGPAVTGPVIPVVEEPACVTGPATDGSAAAPHLVDPQGDRRGTLMTYPPNGDPIVVPDPEGDAYDLRAAWFSDAGDGQLAFSILPWGASHVPGELGYMLRLDPWYIELFSHADGSWSGMYEPADEFPPGPSDIDDQRPVDVAHDPDTGVVTVVLPTEVLPDGDITIDHLSSRYLPYGPAVADASLRTSVLVDTSGDATICAATR